MSGTDEEKAKEARQALEDLATEGCTGDHEGHPPDECSPDEECHDCDCPQHVANRGCDAIDALKKEGDRLTAALGVAQGERDEARADLLKLRGAISTATVERDEARSERNGCFDELALRQEELEKLRRCPTCDGTKLIYRDGDKPNEEIAEMCPGCDLLAGTMRERDALSVENARLKGEHFNAEASNHELRYQVDRRGEQLETARGLIQRAVYDGRCSWKGAPIADNVAHGPCLHHEMRTFLASPGLVGPGAGTTPKQELRCGGVCQSNGDALCMQPCIGSPGQHNCCACARHVVELTVEAPAKTAGGDVPGPQRERVPKLSRDHYILEGLQDIADGEEAERRAGAVPAPRQEGAPPTMECCACGWKGTADETGLGAVLNCPRCYTGKWVKSIGPASPATPQPETVACFARYDHKIPVPGEWMQLPGVCFLPRGHEGPHGPKVPEPTPTQSPEALEAERVRGVLLEGLRLGRRQGLTFGEFGKANRERCESPSGFGRTLDSTNIDSWGLAICGEAGEIADTLYAIGHNPKKGLTLADVLDEVADVVSYCDLMAQRLGSTLEACLVAKWNRVSEKRGYPGRLSPLPNSQPSAATTEGESK